MIKISSSTTRILGVFGLLAAIGAPVLADVPRKQPLGRYADLWAPGKSPFTVPPVVVPPDVIVENPLDDYTLAGVCQLKDGWFVVLINKKQRDERLRIKPNVENSEGFQVVSVDDGDGYMATKVELKTRSGKTGWVEYDKKFIALKKATPKATGNKPPIPGRPGATRPPIPTRPTTNPRPPTPSGNTTSNRPSRVRRVPTPPSR